MPELPEVETIKRGLEPLVVKQKLKSVQVLCEKSFVGDANFLSSEDIEVVAIRRFGKALVLDLANGISLMMHLRMTGQLIYDGKASKAGNTSKISKAGEASKISETDNASGANRVGDAHGPNGSKPPTTYEVEGHERFAAGHPNENFVASLPNKQTRVILEFENGILYFNDQRKFGFIKLLSTSEVENDDFIKKLAKEPWKMTASEFHEKLLKHKTAPIKAVILDQTILCGLGNIYADESLFLSQIHPKRKAGSLSLAEAATLLKNAGAVMEKSIASGGSTMATYLKPDGTRGNYLDLFANVYHRDGQPCLVCGTTIIKLRVGGRGTHICPNCQKLNDSEASYGPAEDALTKDGLAENDSMKNNLAKNNHTQMGEPK